jgi:hypothetical protein
MGHSGMALRRRVFSFQQLTYLGPQERTRLMLCFPIFGVDLRR